MALTETSTFQYVQENSDAFLALFPHRYDFIYAPHPNPTTKPEWRTEDRYPLSDRQLLKGEYLYGVRFQKDTQYCLLDIDRQSLYHPSNSPLVLNRLFESLEPLGITDHIVCTSSDSQGLHIYFPLAKAFNAWKLAKAVSVALENAGFKLKLGQLELFPNPKVYCADETPSLFNAHRLPLQMGSYLLNDDLQPTNSAQAHFVRMWEFCQRRNILNTRRLRTLLKKAKQISYQLSNKASKFLHDLNTEIEEGWTGQGQTNRLLGRITMRSFVFNHITDGGNPLAGKALIDKVVEVAKALPGYQDWCRHRHEIEDRATEWARCIENSHYFPYGTARGKYKEIQSDKPLDGLDWNQKRSLETQEKIATAVEDLLKKQTLPEKATARFKALIEYGIGGASLYRYRELWHPIEFKNSPKESGPHDTDLEDACTEGANDLKIPTSLLSPDDSNSFDSKTSNDSDATGNESQGNNVSDPAQLIRARIKKQLAEAQQARLKAQDEQQLPVADEAAMVAHRRALQRMREFLLSGDPILIAEVGQWLVKQPLLVRNELITSGEMEDQALLFDLCEIAQHLVKTKLSPWKVRFQLEERYGKSIVLELTDSERREWVRSLSRTQNTDD
ncbi:MAG: hypothetical protein AAGC93_24670 [Cyanobacteria bacterium P01_F01_bin.53]